jgi:hypothetical protein
VLLFEILQLEQPQVMASKQLAASAPLLQQLPSQQVYQHSSLQPAYHLPELEHLVRSVCLPQAQLALVLAAVLDLEETAVQVQVVQEDIHREESSVVVPERLVQEEDTSQAVHQMAAYLDNPPDLCDPSPLEEEDSMVEGTADVAQREQHLAVPVVGRVAEYHEEGGPVVGSGLDDSDPGELVSEESVEYPKNNVSVISKLSDDYRGVVSK